MKCLTAMNPGWRPEVPPMPVPNNSTQSGSIAPPNFIRGRYDRHGCRS